MVKLNELTKLAVELAELSIVSERSTNQLYIALEKWFFNEFVKGIKISVLKNIYQCGRFEIYMKLLAVRGDAERIAVLEKVDGHNPDIRTFTKKESYAHLKMLASGAVKPRPKAKLRGKRSQSTPAKGLIAGSKY